MHAVIQRMSADYALFDDVLKPLSLHASAVHEALERCTHANKSISIFARVAAVRQLAAADVWHGRGHLGCTFFATLPGELVDRIVAWSVKLSAEGIRPRTRKIKSLRSLLELSSRFLRELDHRAGSIFDDIPDTDHDTDYDTPSYSMSHFSDGDYSNITYPLHVLPWEDDKGEYEIGSPIDVTSGMFD